MRGPITRSCFRHHRGDSTPRQRSHRWASVVALTTLLLLTAACSSTGETVENTIAQVEGTIDDTTEQLEVDERSAELADALRSRGATSLASMITAVDFDDITDAGDFTFFAPNDDAYLAMSADEMADLLGDPDAILAILRNHVVAERIEAADVVARDGVESVAGNTLEVTATDATVMIDDATVTQTDIDAAGGVIHIVDGLLLP